jgi:hypothetical protein
VENIEAESKSMDSTTKLDFNERYPNKMIFTKNHIFWYLNGIFVEHTSMQTLQTYF